MYKFVLILIALLCSATEVYSNTQSVPDAVKKLVIQEIESSIEIEPIKARNGSEKVFQYPIYKVSPVLGDIAVSDLAVIKLEHPSSSFELLGLSKLLRSDFLISDQSQADLLMKVISPIYPADRRMLSDFQEMDPIKIGNKWIIPRGEFFDDLSGIVFTVDKEGKILFVESVLKINPKDYSFESLFKSEADLEAINQYESNFNLYVDQLKKFNTKESKCTEYAENLRQCKKSNCTATMPIFGDMTYEQFITKNENGECIALTYANTNSTYCVLDTKQRIIYANEYEKMFKADGSVSISSNIENKDYEKILKERCFSFDENGNYLELGS